MGGGAMRLGGPALAGLVLAGLLAGCGYFNTLYNAQRRFAEAERLDRDGQRALARTAYEESLRKAAASYRSHPDGRWADDALYLVGRSHFALGRDEAAVTALETVLALSGDRGMRGAAAAYLGAAAVRAGRADAGLVHLDSAVAWLPADAAERSLAHLWRGRARFATGDQAGGWTALEAAAAGTGSRARDARLEMATRALAVGDSARLVGAVADLLADAGAGAARDSLSTLAAAEAQVRGPAAAARLLAPVEGGAWPVAGLDSLRLVRAGHQAAAGERAAATAALRMLANGAATPTANAGRHGWARLELADAAGLEALQEVRAILLPAVGYTPALRLVDHMRTVDALVRRAGAGRPLALFVAGELARDSLGAPALARGLFEAYADLVPEGVWTPKALLAAASLAPEADAADLRWRAGALAASPYVAADAAGFEEAERRLHTQLGGLLQEAQTDARTRDAAVTQQVATLDSLRLLARTDSLAIVCGARLEAEAAAGIRADSARAACLRGDSARVAFVLALQDTVLLCDSACVGSGMGARERNAGRDTFPPPPGTGG